MRENIGIFTYSVKPRGSVVHAACLAEALEDEGADVTLYALAKPGDEFFRPLRCPLVTFPAAPAPADPGRLVAQRIAELQTGIASVGARHDIHHAEDCLTANALVTAAPAISPVVRTVHHVEEFDNPYLAACQHRSIECCELLFSVSERTAREVEGAFGRTSRVVYNGVDPARFEARSDVEPELVKALALSDGDLVVLSVGGADPRKNMLGALEAMAGALTGNPHLRWVVVGGASIWDHSEHERRFDARVAELPERVRSRIVRLGSVDEPTLTFLYRRSDLLLSVSLHEGWGLCALEALAAGTAVVAPDRAPFTEFLDFRVACLVDPMSTVDIQGAVLSLAHDRERRTALARAGRERAQRFTWRRTAREHLEAYRALLDGSVMPGALARRSAAFHPARAGA